MVCILCVKFFLFDAILTEIISTYVHNLYAVCVYMFTHWSVEIVCNPIFVITDPGGDRAAVDWWRLLRQSRGKGNYLQSGQGEFT